jgi:serine/threonine protein kinase
LVVELAPYNDCLFRKACQRPKSDLGRLYRLPVGEVILMACQLLDTLDFLHNKMNIAYIDWKPEHVFWSGVNRSVKLIDWNVTAPIDEHPGRNQNTIDDVRLLSGAVINTGLTMIEMPPQPTTPEYRSDPLLQIRQRYSSSNPPFGPAYKSLDQSILGIIRSSLSKPGYPSPTELKNKLLDAASELGVKYPPDPDTSGKYYWDAVREIRLVRDSLSKAYDLLCKATEKHTATQEYENLSKVVREAIDNLPLP